MSLENEIAKLTSEVSKLIEAMKGLSQPVKVEEVVKVAEPVKVEEVVKVEVMPEDPVFIDEEPVEVEDTIAKELELENENDLLPFKTGIELVMWVKDKISNFPSDLTQEEIEVKKQMITDKIGSYGVSALSTLPETNLKELHDYILEIV